MNNPVSVLLVRFLSFGDVLLTLPVIEALARSPRVAFVDLLTSTRFSKVMALSPDVRHVFSFDPASATEHQELERTVYDVIIDLHSRAIPLEEPYEAILSRLQGRTQIGYTQPALPRMALAPRARDEHAVDYYMRSVVGLVSDGPGRGRLRIPAAYDAVAQRLPPNAVCIAPGARHPWKRWPVESFTALAGKLTDAGISPVVVGHSFDAEWVAVVHEGCAHSSRIVTSDECLLATIMAACGIVVANASGLSLLADAAGARCVCIHSHTLPVMWRPWGDGHINLVGDETAPCTCKGAASHDLAVACGKAIPVDHVVDALLQLHTERSNERLEERRDRDLDRSRRTSSSPH